MSESGRKQKVVKNVISQTVYTGVQIVMNFVSRKLFVIFLTEELLGLNSLLLSILSMLSIAELGVGEAINFSLYKPLAEGDKKTTNAIMKMYQKLYIVIGIAIVVLGIMLLPFLQYMKNITMPMEYVYKVYLLFLLDTFLSYCLAYSRNIISADQKDYIVTNTDSIAQIIMTVVQIIIIAVTKSYVGYLIVKIIVTVVRNFYLYMKSFQLFPYLKDKDVPELSKEYKHNLFENVKALFVIKVATYCVSGTDNLLLTHFVSLTSVAVYGNYVTIFTAINKGFNAVFDKARASIGNYLETENEAKVYTLFKKIFFINFILTSYTSIIMFIVGNELITIWMGRDFLWSLGIVGILVLNNYSRYILQSCEAFRGAAGLYSPRKFVKYLSLLEGIINLVVSLLLLKVFDLGVYGVFLGTMVSTVVSTIAVPWIVYRFLFQKPLYEYFILYFKYLLSGIFALVTSYILYTFVRVDNAWFNLFVGAVCSTLVTAIVYFVCYSRSDEFKYSFDLAKKIFGKLNKK